MTPIESQPEHVVAFVEAESRFIVHNRGEPGGPNVIPFGIVKSELDLIGEPILDLGGLPKLVIPTVPGGLGHVGFDCLGRQTLPAGTRCPAGERKGSLEDRRPQMKVVLAIPLEVGGTPAHHTAKRQIAENTAAIRTNALTTQDESHGGGRGHSDSFT